MTTEALAFERGVAPLLDKILPEKLSDILNFRPDVDLQKRIEELATKCTEGELSTNELREYEGYVRANKFLAVIHREARKLSGATS